jgi:Animal haem peroxidase/Catalase
MTPKQQWQEVYEGGSAEAERLVFEQLARAIINIQSESMRRSKGGEILRAFHAKPIAGVMNATLRFRRDLPDQFRAGFAQPDKAYPAIVRFSNGHGSVQPDHRDDMRGVAVRVKVSADEYHDLLLTNTPVTHARNARQFVAFARANAADPVGRVLRRLGLAVKFGPFETLRMLRLARAERRPNVRSLALESYWSRGAIRWGEQLAVRYMLRPPAGASADAGFESNDPDYLRRDLAARLRDGDVDFELCLQSFVEGTRTPIEDPSVEWAQSVSPLVPVATLKIPRQDIGSVEAQTAERLVDQLAFNPWHTTDEFRPLGNLNRARKAAYTASAHHRLGYRFNTEVPLRNVIAGGLARGAFRGVNRFVPWHHLPYWLALLNLSGFRHTLRQRNLIDTEIREAPPAAAPVPPPIGEDVRTARTYDGAFNDLCDAKMGAVGATFGRNMKPVYRPDLFNSPNPIVVSKQLLYRETFLPARSLNTIAAAWIQFQVHDWVNHARYPLGRNDVVVPLPPGMTWQSQIGGPSETVMRFPDNQELVPGKASKGRPPILFGNTASHWWDGSEVYGPNEKEATALREKVLQNGMKRAGAKLLLEDGYLPVGAKGMELTGFNESWWLGLSALHTLFAREHNVVCDALRRQYPYLSDERVYQTARLIVSALIAKIHTVEWTPAILAIKAIDVGLKGNWYGPKSWLTRLGLWLLDTHALKGITQTMPDHHTAPYSLTEEFVAVYRMHPLLPDDYQLFNHADGSLIRKAGFLDLQGDKTDEVMRKTTLENTLYTLGIAHPGAITLHNFPRSLQEFERASEPSGSGRERIDLSVVDLVRTRRRGVPRYNDFREALHRPRVRRWEDLTEDPESVRRLKDVYKEIDLVDTMVGLFAETPPQGFGFSDTAFRIFILMASRRLQSDRFLTVDFRPEIYTPLGLDWVAQNGMTSVILRHCPDLTAVVPRTASAFVPWRPIAS